MWLDADDALEQMIDPGILLRGLDHPRRAHGQHEQIEPGRQAVECRRHLGKRRQQQIGLDQAFVQVRRHLQPARVADIGQRPLGQIVPGLVPAHHAVEPAVFLGSRIPTLGDVLAAAGELGLDQLGNGVLVEQCAVMVEGQRLDGIEPAHRGHVLPESFGPARARAKGPRGGAIKA